MSTMQHITPGKSRRCHQASWVFIGASGDWSSAWRNHRAFTPHYHTQNLLQRAHSWLCAGGVPGGASWSWRQHINSHLSTNIPSIRLCCQLFGSHAHLVCSLCWEKQALFCFFSPWTTIKVKRMFQKWGKKAEEPMKEHTVKFYWVSCFKFHMK